MLDLKTTFREWRAIAPFSDFEMRKFSRPAFVGDYQTPETLNDLTIGQLIELSEVNEHDAFFKICGVILGMQPQDVDKARATDVVRFGGWVLAEVEKINNLFGNIETKPTPQERQAGVDKLKFGLFGLIDWYARRMGITDHDEVFGVAWLRIYKCLDMDTKQNLYQRRLQEVYNNEHRRSIGRHR